MDPALLGRVAALRQPRPLLAAFERIQVGHVLLQNAQRGVALQRGAVPGHHGVGAPDHQLQGGQRAAVVRRRAARGDHRDLDRREVVAHHQHADPGGEDRHAVGACARRWRTARAPPHPARAGRAPAATGSGRARAAAAAPRSSARRGRAVRAAPRPGGRASAASSTRPRPARGRGRPSGRARGRSRAWVASRATGSKPDWASTAGSSSSSSGKYGESISIASSPARSATAFELPEQAGDDDRVLVYRDRAHGPSSLRRR